MKIGIIGAMEEEVTLLRDKIENRQTISLGTGWRYFKIYPSGVVAWRNA